MYRAAYLAAAEIFVVEGVMGLFDGLAGPPGRRGATADLAARFRLPVLLVLDVSGQSQTAAAAVSRMMSRIIFSGRTRTHLSGGW